MEFIQSERGAQKLLYEGHVYVKQKALASGAVSYECEKRRLSAQNQGQCRAKVRVQGDAIVGRTNEHTHAPIPGRGAKGQRSNQAASSGYRRNTSTNHLPKRRKYIAR